MQTEAAARIRQRALSERKLRDIAADLAGRACPPAGVVVADVADEASVAAMAASTAIRHP